MTIHAMVDLETLDTTYSATILTIGAVKFDPFSTAPMEEFYVRVDIDSQDALGCTAGEKTLEWWARQKPEIQEEAFSPENRILVGDAIKQLHTFLWGSSKIWAHGPHFDITILEHLYTKLGLALSWNYYEVRDTRTIYDLAEPDMPQNAKHNALEDAKRQAIGVRNVYRKLGYIGKPL